MKKNKGFSVIEVIIVIAIMAILVGLVAMNVIRYLEKSNVGADLRYLDAISAAVTYALMDPEVIKDPTAAATISTIDAATASSQGISLSALGNPDGNRIAKEIMTTMGWDSLSSSEYMQMIKSKHSGDSDIYIQHKGGALTPYAVWITYTDATGGKDTSQGPTKWVDGTGVGICICAQ